VGGGEFAVVGPGGKGVGREGGEAANFVTGEATESGKERRLGGEEGEVGASSAGTGSIGEALPG
jgi:hypothetical protein